VSGSGTSWAICKSAPRSRQITTPAPHRSVFYSTDSRSHIGKVNNQKTWNHIKLWFIPECVSGNLWSLRRALWPLLDAAQAVLSVLDRTLVHCQYRSPAEQVHELYDVRQTWPIYQTLFSNVVLGSVFSNCQCSFMWITLNYVNKLCTQIPRKTFNKK